ncbi:uncharacterized protein LOC125940771 [Dermacentor silvarum]|uniref:uncharacterized protein LOC125940771 n=1 Tax=Dermacentor silvarum TaxID=543639 RepID=UPI0021015252|nr:uncharacterized protein LOC125940771 [Dermacentor silvarum]
MCSVVDATSCYWNTAVKYIVRDMISQLAAETAHLKKLCGMKKKLPPVSNCTFFYAGCSEDVGRHFQVQEHGYQVVQRHLVDRAKCETLGILNSCIDTTSLLQKCRISLVLEPTVENARNNAKAASKLGLCLRDVLSPCSKGEHQYAKDHVVNSYTVALMAFFWHDSVTVPHVLPSTWKPRTFEFNDTDGNPTTTPASQSGAAVMLPLGALLLLLITLLGTYTELSGALQ